MNLKLPGDEPTPEERRAVDRALDGQPVDGHGTDTAGRRHLLLPALQAAQKEAGWISKGALGYICGRLGVPPADAYGVASFYALLSTSPRPPRVAHVCDDIACRVAGSEHLCQQLDARLGPAGSPLFEGKATWHRSPCLGLCERGPAVYFQVAGHERDGTLAPASADGVAGVLRGDPVPDPPDPPESVAPQTREPRAPGLRLLRRLGVAMPDSFDSYRAHGGYVALQHAIALGPAGTIREILDSRLLGRGGAAFPTGRKWEAVSRNPVRPHYVVCNADESEPGTFKDRVLMERDPFAVVEAMTIAGFAVGADRGFVYIRGEYPLAMRRMTHAIDEARRRGLLGRDVMRSGLSFDIEVRRGAGAYICGEETALFNSIEGYRGEPRNKPPFPTDEGLFGKPTVVNNVETFATILDILVEGGPAASAVGTRDSTGHKLFCVSGCVKEPGLYEVPFGATLRAVLGLAGGARDGRTFRAFLLGGAAGSFVGTEHLDVPLTFEGLRSIGASLGSGVVMAFDDHVELGPIVERIARFFREESCGQCVPCRVGTARQEEAVQRLVRGRPLGSLDDERRLLDDLALAMRDASICGLGQTAGNAVGSALALGLVGGRERTE